MPVTEKTVAELLQAADYATGAIGKWTCKEPGVPSPGGFTEFYGFLGRPVLLCGDAPGPARPTGPPVPWDAAADDPEYLTDAFGREAVAFIERHKREPFFLYLAFNAPHVPLEATAKYRMLPGESPTAVAVRTPP